MHILCTHFGDCFSVRMQYLQKWKICVRIQRSFMLFCYVWCNIWFLCIVFFFFSRMLSLTNYRYDLLFSWESAHLFMIIHLRNVFTWCTPFEQHVSALFGLCFNDFDAPPWDTILTNIQFLFLIYFFSVSLKFTIFMIFDRMILYHKKVPQRMEHSRIFN